MFARAVSERTLWALAMLVGVTAVASWVAPQRLRAQDALQRVEQQIEEQRAAEQAEPAGAEPGYWGLLADEGTDAGHGVRIREVIPGGPAAQAGLQVDDVIVAVGNTPIRTVEHLADVVERSPPGARLVLTVLRPLPGVGMQTRNVSITLGRRPPAEQWPLAEFGPLEAGARSDVVMHGVLGVGTRWQREAARRPAAQQGAAVVVEVIANSPAAGAGLAVGDALLAVDGIPLADHDDLRRRLQARAGQRVELAYERQGQVHRVALTLADDRPRPMPPPRIVGAAEAPAGGAMVSAGADASTAQRLEALQRRVNELEDRVRQLEAELRTLRGR